MMIITLESLEKLICQSLAGTGMNKENSKVMADVYIRASKRRTGHHDIHDLPQRLKLLKAGLLNPDPSIEQTASFGAMEQYDGDNGPGELISFHIMRRATELAAEHGIGLCTARHSNHYLCSYPYVMQAAERGYIGLIIAKAMPTMGIPGSRTNVIGQSPIGLAFSSGDASAALDICLAYASGGKLKKMAEEHAPVPSWWGADQEGNPAVNAEDLLCGVKYPIGEHKGFGLALFCELMTGVLSGGEILDDPGDDLGRPEHMGRMSHTALAVRADALMTPEEFAARSAELLIRLKKRDSCVRIPGEESLRRAKACDVSGEIDVEESLIREIEEELA